MPVWKWSKTHESRKFYRWHKYRSHICLDWKIKLATIHSTKFGCWMAFARQEKTSNTIPFQEEAKKIGNKNQLSVYCRSFNFLKIFQSHQFIENWYKEGKQQIEGDKHIKAIPCSQYERLCQVHTWNYRNQWEHCAQFKCFSRHQTISAFYLWNCEFISTLSRFVGKNDFIR